MKIALAQLAPVLLNKVETLSKVASAVESAAKGGAHLVVFGEATVPGYPWWTERTNGAAFDDPLQKQLYARYVEEAVEIEANGRGDLDQICRLAKDFRITVVIGVIEKSVDRGRHSLYCSAVTIGNDGLIVNIHRKLVPTFEERLVWAPGDGHGLKVTPVEEFQMGVLNCWENWMPLSRTALYAQGENLHVAIWPGSSRNTTDITRFVAMESRSFVVSVSNIMNKNTLAESHTIKAIPGYEKIIQEVQARKEDWIANGGSCVSRPDGKWLLEPVVNQETVLFVQLDHDKVLQERANFDPAGHYSRPDVTRLVVDRRRQMLATFIDN